MMANEPQQSRSSDRRRETTGLVMLFGAMYLVQGIAEPTEGLIAQPVRSLLKSWGYTAAAIAGFGALLALPWSLKPLYGLLTDFVPLARTRRRSYLILTSGISSLALLVLYLIPIPFGSYQLLLYLLLVPTVGVAFSDVVVDALMIEKGQPRGLGRNNGLQCSRSGRRTFDLRLLVDRTADESRDRPRQTEPDEFRR